ncbi:MAG: radical SAM protein [Proteobacteria bacterium]|nr:radical SAM protein [Pseudomonadota bacterium]
MSIVADFKASLAHGRERDNCSRDVKAIDAIIYLTYRCTSRCKTCNIWKRNEVTDKTAELGWEEWKQILTNMRDYGIKSVEIFGGDALLRKDIIFDIIRFCTDNGMGTYFPTNSISIDRETVKKFVDTGLDTIYFSLDNVGSKHDEIRGKDGGFTLVKEAIENFAELRGEKEKPTIVICNTISKNNYDSLEDITEFSSKYPVDAVYPRVMEEYSQENIDASAVDGVLPEPYFTPTDDISNLMSEEQAREFWNVIDKSMKSTDKSVYVNYMGPLTITNEVLTKGSHAIPKCRLCTTVITVDPLGNVTPCLMFNNYHIGNLLTEKLTDIWGNDRHKLFIEQQRQNKINICKNCNLNLYYPGVTQTVKYYIKRAIAKIRKG